MKHKNLAKAVLLAMTLGASTATVDAASNVGGFETSTLLAVGGCGQKSPSPYQDRSQGNGYYSQQNSGSSQYYDQQTANDVNNPYATPNGGGYSTNNWNTNRSMSGGGATNNNSNWNNNRSMSGGGANNTNNNWNTNKSMSGGGSQGTPYDADQGTQSGYSSSPYNSSQTMGGGSLNNPSRSNGSSLSSSQDDYNSDTSNW